MPRRHDEWKGSGQIPFDPQPPPAVAYEPKSCEMCPRTFLRIIGAKTRYCPACLRLAKMAPPVLSPMNPQRETRAYHRKTQPLDENLAEARAAVQAIQRTAGKRLLPWQRDLVIRSFAARGKTTVH